MEKVSPSRSSPSVLEKPVDLSKRLKIGRAADADLQLADGTVSRYHALIEWSDRTGYVLRDNGSRVGTFVNGRLCDQHDLVYGDRIQIGPFLMRFAGRRLEPLREGEGGTIEAIKLTRRFGKKTTLLNINISIPPSQFIGIVGTSGAGKSTLLDALSGMRAPSDGTVLIDGANLYRHRWTSPACGYVPQDDIVHRELNVRQALHFSALLRLPGDIESFEVEKLVDYTIRRLGLAERADLPIDRLSGGQRKRVSIGAELLSRPRVLFLDEPSSGLDPSTETKLMELLRDLANTGCTTVCTTHVMENVYLMDQVVVVHAGRLIFFGPPDVALTHFEIPRFTALYDRLEEKSAAEWEEQYLKGAPPPAPGLSRRNSRPDGDTSTKANFFRVLWNRHLALLRADKRALTMLIGQPIVIGLMVAWMADVSDLKLFLAYLATLWFGCSNAGQEIVKEISIYRRERLVGLPRSSYLFTKIVFLGIATSLQSLVVFICLQFGAHLLEGAKAWQLCCLLATAWASVGIGLSISALVRTTTQAVMLVPLILLPQIVFSGYVLPSLATGTGVKKVVTDLMPSFAAQRIMDVSLLWNRPLTAQFIAHNFSYDRVDPKKELKLDHTYLDLSLAMKCLLELMVWTAATTALAGFGLKLRERNT
jgi:ABC-type multidrug transport system ATPase subunit